MRIVMAVFVLLILAAGALFVLGVTAAPDPREIRVDVTERADA